jgi:hypothetical protein
MENSHLPIKVAFSQKFPNFSAFNASLSQSPNQSLAWLGEALIHEYTNRPDALQQARTFYKGAASQAIEVQSFPIPLIYF